MSHFFTLLCMFLSQYLKCNIDFENHPVLCKHQSYCCVTLGQTVISPRLTYGSSLSSSPVVVVLGFYWRVQIVSDIITEPETNDLSCENNELKSLKVHGDSRGLILALRIFISFIYYVLQALNRCLLGDGALQNSTSQFGWFTFYFILVSLLFVFDSFQAVFTFTTKGGLLSISINRSC